MNYSTNPTLFFKADKKGTMVQITSKNLILKFLEGIYETSEVVRVEVFEVGDNKFEIDIVVKEVTETGSLEEQDMSLPLKFSLSEKDEFLRVLSVIFLT